MRRSPWIAAPTQALHWLGSWTAIKRIDAARQHVRAAVPIIHIPAGQIQYMSIILTYMEAAMSDDAHPDLIALGERWIAAWNSRDLDRILALYADDAEMTSDGIVRLGLHCAGLGPGKQNLRAYWSKALALLPDLHFARDRLLHQPEQRRGALHQRPRANDLRVPACRPGRRERRSHRAGISKPSRSCGVAVALRRAAIGSDAVVLQHLLAGGRNLGPVLLQAAQDHHVAGIHHRLAEARDVAAARALLACAWRFARKRWWRTELAMQRQKQNLFQRHVPYLRGQHNVAATSESNALRPPALMRSFQDRYEKPVGFRPLWRHQHTFRR